MGFIHGMDFCSIKICNLKFITSNKMHVGRFPQIRETVTNKEKVKLALDKLRATISGRGMVLSQYRWFLIHS